MKFEKDERIEDLQCGGLKIIQNKNFYTFTSDSVVLANFISTKKADKCVEIGTGCGVISILLSKKTNFEKITAFEIQQEMFSLAQKNIKLNSLEEKIDLINDDIQNFEKYFPKESANVVFSNPPYMKEEIVSPNKVRAVAMHENLLPLQTLCMVSSKMLKNGGKFFVVYGANRTSELICELCKNKLEPKRMFFTENGRGKVILCVVEAVKGGRKGVEILPNLVTNDKDGKYLEILHTRYVK